MNFNMVGFDDYFCADDLLDEEKKDEYYINCDAESDDPAKNNSRVFIFDRKAQKYE